MKLHACGTSDIGLQRRNNEDSFFLDEQLGLFIVADGMGGHAAGEIASNMAITELQEQIAAAAGTKPPAEQWQELIAAAMRKTNQSIITAGKENKSWAGMGTTLTLVLMTDQQALLTHIGDSRFYRFRTGQLEQLSIDQTLVADQVRRGVLTSAEAEKSTMRNILLQAVGTTEKLDIYQKAFPVHAGDSFLLCSDGLTGMLSDLEISKILTEQKRPEPACRQLIKAALAAGGKDNVTAVLLETDNK